MAMYVKRRLTDVKWFRASRSELKFAPLLDKRRREDVNRFGNNSKKIEFVSGVITSVEEVNPKLPDILPDGDGSYANVNSVVFHSSKGAMSKIKSSRIGKDIYSCFFHLLTAA
ncbi:hypothetical protein PIB30_021888 [Stylosanthes scabra]|uniref:Uncharacterized protein n=1 Tax=Stylosanthes scabra TaxID=79078 RepID=A0ABU6S9A0_9FABA|nr:hypothetical protein [Stylosanthes scabra]